MNDKEWAWAALNANQLTLLKEAENTLSTKSMTLLAYKPDQKVVILADKFKQDGLQFAALNSSQIECLVGLEQKLGSVVVAYS